VDLRETGSGWIGFDWLMIGTGGELCECGDEPSGSCSTELFSLVIIFNVFYSRYVIYIKSGFHTSVRIRMTFISDALFVSPNVIIS
jgi:hypothetical protein